MRWLTVAILAAFLGSATTADAQVFKRRGKGGSTAKAKSPTAKKPATKTAAKKPAAKSAKKPAKGSKVAAARPSDLTPDPVDADSDYVLIEDLDE